MSDADLPPSADDDTPEAFDARRRRAMRRGVLTGVGIAGGLALLAGFGGATPELRDALLRMGASRVCEPGSLQAPPLDWRNDGHGVVASLVRE